jgi:hypothetical protein
MIKEIYLYEETFEKVKEYYLILKMDLAEFSLAELISSRKN